MALWRRIVNVPAGPLVHLVQAHRGAAAQCEQNRQRDDRGAERVVVQSAM